MPLRIWISLTDQPSPSLGSRPKIPNEENIPASDDHQVSVKEKKTFVNIPVSNELQEFSFGSIPEDEKECDDELVLMAENASIGEKRKNQSQSTPTRKKKKIEAVEPLLEDRVNNDEQANHFATSYFMKAKAELDEPTFLKFISLLSEVNESNTNIITLYNEMMDLLSKHSDLAEEFIGFLHPHQALEVQKFTEYIQFESCWNFFRKIDAFHLNKVYHLLEQHMLNPSVTSETIKNSLLSTFKGHPNISEGLLYFLPGEKPPASCKEDFEDISDLGLEESSMWEKLSIPEQLQRGCAPDLCDCPCHLCIPKKFCTFCNIKFSNGQIYVQTGKGLRFAKVTFRGCHQDEVLYQLNPTIYSKPVERKRTKSLSHQTKASHASEPPPKSEIVVETIKDADKCKEIDLIELTKEAIPAEIEENDCEVAIELVLPLVQNEEIICVNEQDALEKISDAQMCIVLDNALETSENVPTSNAKEEDVHETTLKAEEVEIGIDKEIKNDKSESNKIKIEVDKCDRKTEETINEIIVKDSDVEILSKEKEIKIEEEKLENKPRLWTREEDKLILQAFQKQLSTEQTFSRISDLMPNRTVEDIQGRFQVLMNLLEQMTSGSNYPS
ncbi:GON-4-like protein isoform X2 [Halyomorpha halys]|uniref:GON-4-like protein isoform X2 n=1 Tax=Halyomorpha halys TaxID=286706 RepID=UPI0006D51FBF|nr:uncharacterized protein LOC106690437 isoform X2 [Halyomorpha halys]